MQLLQRFEEWQTVLTEFTALLKERMKASRQNKVLAQITLEEGKPLTRSSYNARLRYPHLWPPEIVEQLANVLDCPQLLALFHKQKELISGLPDLLNSYVKSAATSNAFVIRKLGINQATFYAKQREPHLWRMEELARIEEVIETLKEL